jgi:hypothetical protein
MIISRGLGDLLANNVDTFQKCIKTKYPTEFGDRAFTGCLWELGIAPTDPGPFLLGTSPEPLFGTFQRGNPGVPLQFLEQTYNNRDLELENEALRNKMNGIASMITWHAKAGTAGRRLSDVIADMDRFVKLMDNILLP